MRTSDSAKFFSASGSIASVIAALSSRLIGVDLLEQRLCRRLQMQPANAPILGVGTPLDEAARLEPVDEPRHGDRLDLDETGEFVLRQARLTLEPDEDDPLGAGHAIETRTLIRPRPHQACDVVEQDQVIDFAVAWAWQFPNAA